MSVSAVRWAFSLPVKPASTKFVLVALANHVPKHGERLSYPSQPELCEMTGLNPKTVKKALDQLSGEEVISDTGQRKGRTGQVIVYRLNIEEKGTENGPVKEDQERPPFDIESPPILPPKGTVFTVKAPQKRTTEREGKGKGKGIRARARNTDKNKEASWQPPDGLNLEAWSDFEKHRKEIRKPLTDQARTLAASKLIALSRHGQQTCVNNSIEKRWTGLFPEKVGSGKTDPASNAAPDTDWLSELGL